MKLEPPIDWPSSTGKTREPDTRMCRCVLDGYFDCPAKIPAACICSMFPADVYLAKMRAKYGDERDVE